MVGRKEPFSDRTSPSALEIRCRIVASGLIFLTQNESCGSPFIGLTSRCKIIVNDDDDDNYDTEETEGDVTAAQKARFGCEELIILENEPNKSYASYTSVDIVKRVMEITGGIGCKLIIDGIGLLTYEISLNCLAQRGLFVSYGNASGPVPPFPVLRLLPQSAYMTRPKLNDYINTRDELLARAEEVFEWVRTEKLNIVIDKVFALDEVALGHEYLENGSSRGKVLYKI